MSQRQTFFTKIVGVTFRNEDGSDRQTIIRNLILNGNLRTGTELFFVPQPTNPYDSNCILVKAANGQILGCLAREVAAQVAPQIRQGDSFKAYVESQTGGSYGCAYGINLRVERYWRDEKASSFCSASDAKTNAEAENKIGEELFNQFCFSQAIPHLQRAADAGIAAAQYRLAICYDDGKGVERNLRKAFELYKLAAMQGYAPAENSLAYSYCEGEGTDIDYNEAIRWYRRASEHGDTSGTVGLGACYERGLGVRVDYEEAYRLFRKAAELGDREGMSNTGIYLLTGKGVERDPYEAAKWNLKAAEKGQVKAQFNLGLQYLKGDGVAKDKVEAVYWIRQSALNGYPPAQEMAIRAGLLRVDDY